MNWFRQWLVERRLKKEWDECFWETLWLEVTWPQHYLDHIEAVRKSLPDDHDAHLAAYRETEKLVHNPYGGIAWPKHPLHR